MVDGGDLEWQHFAVMEGLDEDQVNDMTFD